VSAKKNERDTENSEELEGARELLNAGLSRVKILGILTFANIGSIIPFLAGYPLHKYFYTIGRPLLVSGTCLWTLFILSVAQAWFLWSDVRDIKKSEIRKP
jgi:hypothetical protein